MKKRTNPKDPDPSGGAGDPDEPMESKAVPGSSTPGFAPLPNDFAPTRPVPEADSAVRPPEFRSLEVSPVETSTLAMPVKDLDQGKTAEISPALLPDARSKSTPVPEPPSRKTAGSPRKLWLGVGICALLAAGATATWHLWPKARSGAEDTADEAIQPAAAETVPPELRPYMDQAKTGDAKAMHMIAIMYWNGLNVRQDRVKGLEWYRKAAAAGSTAAQETLKAIEGK